MATNDELSDLADRMRTSVRAVHHTALGLDAVLARRHRLLGFDELVEQVREALKWQLYEPRVGMRAPDVWVVVGRGGIPDDTRMIVEHPNEPRPDVRSLKRSGAVLWGPDLLRQAPRLREGLADGDALVPFGREGDYVLRRVRRVAGPVSPGRPPDP